MTDPVRAAARSMFDRSAADVRAAIEGASPGALNWQPADETNSIAVLTVHAMQSARSWFCVATGTPEPPRDRDAEFATTAVDAASLLAFFEGVVAECRELLTGDEPVDWSEPRSTVRQPTSAPQPITAAWALLHAVEHLREHVAHLQLTRQLWEARGE